MRMFAAAVLSFFLLSTSYAMEPVTPNPSPEARSLLRKLTRAGRNTLAGQHNFPYNLSQHSDDTARVAGKYPCMCGSDFGFTGGNDKASIEGREAMIEEAKRQHAAVSITLMRHVVRPVDDEPVKPGTGWVQSVQNRLGDFETKELITRGTELHRQWETQIATDAKYLKELHIWVWNSSAPNGKNAGPYADFFPGRCYCDILATDVYGEFKQSHHDHLAELAGGISIALGEVGAVPTSAVLKDHPKWTWFMIRADLLKLSKPESVRELFGDPRTLSRGDPLH